MDKSWIIREQGEREAVRHLMTTMNVSEPLANLMLQRGITDKKIAGAFFCPSLDTLYDPFLMKDMNLAVERLDAAIHKNEKILVYGDYDVDGTTAVALVYSFLRDLLSANVDFYIPDRYDEGYGISFKGIDYAANNNCKLMIALDCGIKAVEKIEYANSKGLDVIICDHHYPGDTKPAATAVLDPKQPECNYPFKELTGCGVGFKLVCAYSKISAIPFECIKGYLDLVAVSIASDIVPLTGENRTLAYYGLIQLNESPRIGLRGIIRESSISHKIAIEDLVFKIGPRINAAGRMETGSKAVDLLVSESKQVAERISKEIDTFNSERRTIDRLITSEAMKMIAETPRMLSSKTTVLYNPAWKKGVIGIVASRLIETYYRPTIILTDSNGFVTGSARSVVGYDLYQAIESCSDLLESFGGHMFAAGLTMKKENIASFINKFEQYVASTITEDQLMPIISVDMELPFSNINMDFFQALNNFQPFGPENMSPVFVSRNIYDTGECRMVGTNGEHLKLCLYQNDNIDNPISAIAFGQADFYDYINAGKPVDICYSIEMNEFRGKRTLQLNVRDIKIHQ